jgi:FKBP-type peptidyl-prolyl cis-trans isomerase SlyD|tara:strand:- start:50 stop:532 length:483 start_codon:yes stop_codon:yes gene_type:complete
VQLTKDKVVNINYTLKDKESNIMDESNDGTFTYLHGAKNLIPALERALEGKTSGDKVNVVVPPENAYGLRDEKKIQHVPRKMFPVDQKLEIGMPFSSATPDGTAVNVVITGIEETEVIIDGNHPLADVELHFNIEIIDVRDATKEELEHGHVHGPGGHQH